MMNQKCFANNLCPEREHLRNYTAHRQKLANIKPAVDNKSPPVYPHLYQKLKKAQLEEDRCAEVERDNLTLVRRMGDIMCRPGFDNTKPHGKPASLNYVIRKNELARITKENHRLLKRLQERHGTYNHLVWEQDREKNEQLCERISRYPYRPARSISRKNESNLPSL